MATKMDHVKTDILPDGSQSEPDYRHLMSSKDPDNAPGVMALIVIVCLAFAFGIVSGYYAGYQKGRTDQLVEVIVRGVK